ncbi:ETX/MTX2 family pore-forming toxin [Paracoccus sp. DMF]|uniref:ETX/MTX2 family pore-forming toxin n=1 Tax=Paracoccus sp. DMF TaxID=400837 RepID=UPI0021E419A4|nr:ETX/MTX2 family pore-forming toxin [Paracoccus sp. DMF]MCV2449672.1 ETX/MTX2 family pore-forming toxin [Paracoccus sp. DMF]
MGLLDGFTAVDIAGEEKKKLRARLKNDPGIYIDLNHEVYWLLVRKYPESDIEIEALEIVLAQLDVDEGSSVETVDDVEADRRVFENNTDKLQSRDYNFSSSYVDQTTSSFSKNITSATSSTSSVNLSLSVPIGAVVGGSIGGGASYSITRSLTTAITTGSTTSGTETKALSVSEKLEVPPRSYLVVTVSLSQKFSISKVSGFVQFDGVAKVKKSYNDLKLGRQSMQYLLRDDAGRKISVDGQIRTTYVSETKVNYAEGPLDDTSASINEFLMALPETFVSRNTKQIPKSGE